MIAAILRAAADLVDPQPKLALLAGLAAARRRAHAAEAELELFRRQVLAIDAEDRDAAGEPRS